MRIKMQLSFENAEFSNNIPGGHHRFVFKTHQILSQSRKG